MRVREGLLDRIWGFLSELIPHSEVEWNRGQPITIAELHCPPALGAEAKFERHEERNETAGFRVKARGVGAGGGVGGTVGIRSHVKVDGRCILITLRGDLRTMRWRHRWTDAELEFSSLTRISDKIKSAAIPDAQFHPCASDYVTLWPTYRQRISAGTLDMSCIAEHCIPRGGIAEGQEVALSATRRFRFGGLGLEIETVLTNGVKHSYSVAGPGGFLGYFPAGDSAAFFWSWTTESVECD